MVPIEKVKDIIAQHDTLEKELSSGSIDPKLFAKKSKDYSRLGRIVSTARLFVNFENEKKDLENIMQDKTNDQEMVDLAQKDLNELIGNREKYESELKLFLLPKDEDDDKNAIVEIRAGTGGLEASLFCSDLFKMYEKVCSKKKWQLEIINISKSEAGGFKEVVFSVNGNDIYSYLKYESGVHRVQRIPETETQGRVHTSTATVAVLPEARDVEIKIDENGLFSLVNFSDPDHVFKKIVNLKDEIITIVNSLPKALPAIKTNTGFYVNVKFTIPVEIEASLTK